LHQQIATRLIRYAPTSVGPSSPLAAAVGSLSTVARLATPSARVASCSAKPFLLLDADLVHEAGHQGEHDELLLAREGVYAAGGSGCSATAWMAAWVTGHPRTVPSGRG